MRTAVVVGTENRQARDVANWFGENGYRVYEIGTEELLCKDVIMRRLKLIAEEAGALDLLVIQHERYMAGDCEVGKKRDYTQMLEMISQSILGIQALLDTAVPLLRKGEKKRIVFLSHAEASISNTEDTQDFTWHMILCSCHMLLKNYFNLLRPEGFTFRCYALDYGEAFSAAEYASADFCYHPRVPFAHSEENRMVLRDGMFREIAW